MFFLGVWAQVVQRIQITGGTEVRPPAHVPCKYGLSIKREDRTRHCHSEKPCTAAYVQQQLRTLISHNDSAVIFTIAAVVSTLQLVFKYWINGATTRYYEKCKLLQRTCIPSTGTAVVPQYLEGPAVLSVVGYCGVDLGTLYMCDLTAFHEHLY